MLLEVRLETEGPLLVVKMIWGFLSIFNKSEALSPVEALNTACLSRCQRDLRPPVQIRRGPRVFFRDSTGDSAIPSSCEMEDEPAFKPMLGNPSFFLVRPSQCQFHLRQQTQGPSHIPIAEGSLRLRCLWQVGIPLHSKPGNHISSRDDLGCTELSSSCCAEIAVPLDLGQLSQENSGVANRKSSHLSFMMWNLGWLWSQCNGSGLHLHLIWGTLSCFAFLW